MQRIDLDGAFGGHGFAHEARRVDDLDGLLRGDAGGDELTAAGEAEHQVLLDKAEGDVQVGLDEALVDIDRRAAAGRSERAVVRECAGVVVDHAVARWDVGAEDGVDLGGCCGAVQAGSDEDGDAVDGNAGCVQAVE